MCRAAAWRAAASEPTSDYLLAIGGAAPRDVGRERRTSTSRWSRCCSSLALPCARKGPVGAGVGECSPGLAARAIRLESAFGQSGGERFERKDGGASCTSSRRPSSSSRRTEAWTHLRQKLACAGLTAHALGEDEAARRMLEELAAAVAVRTGGYVAADRHFSPRVGSRCCVRAEAEGQSLALALADTPTLVSRFALAMQVARPSALRGAMSCAEVVGYDVECWPFVHPTPRSCGATSALGSRLLAGFCCMGLRTTRRRAW